MKVRAAVALSKLLPVVMGGSAAMLSVLGGCGFQLSASCLIEHYLVGSYCVVSALSSPS